MPTRLGTVTIADLIQNRFQSPVAFGLNTIAEVIAMDLAAHNRNTQEILSFFAITSPDRHRISGGSTVGSMEAANEFSRPDTQKLGLGDTVGFPLRLYQIGVGWTTRWFQTRTVADVAEQYQNAKKAHLIRLRKELQKAIYSSANYTFFDDLVSPSINMPVKRFTNADGFPIPDGPNGETFDGTTHQHFLANAGLLASSIQSLVNTVVEHGHAEGLTIAINQADFASFSALTGFTKATPVTLVQGIPNATPATSGFAAQRTIQNQPTSFNNRYVGQFDAAEVWIKPWALAGYAVCWAAGDAAKPLVLRTRAGGGPDLVVAAELESYPMHAQYLEAEFGIGAWNRTNGAVLDFVHGSYTVPVIAA